MCTRLISFPNRCVFWTDVYFFHDLQKVRIVGQRVVTASDDYELRVWDFAAARWVPANRRKSFFNRRKSFLERQKSSVNRRKGLFNRRKGLFKRLKVLFIRRKSLFNRFVVMCVALVSWCSQDSLVATQLRPNLISLIQFSEATAIKSDLIAIMTGGL